MNDMFTVMSGAVSQERRLDTISHNLANVSTAGFRKAEVGITSTTPEFNFSEFWDLTQQSVIDQGQPTSVMQMPLAAPTAPKIDLSTGPIVKTDHPFDVAIVETTAEMRGRAFFAVESPNGPMMARDGKFVIGIHEGDAKLIHQTSGYPVLGQGGQIELENGTVVIGKDGTISVDGDEVDQLRLVTFNGDQEVVRAGTGLYTLKENPTAFEDVDEEHYKIQQGFIEQSNVNAVDELVRMIRVQRSYDAMTKMMQTVDESRGRLINMGMQG